MLPNIALTSAPVTRSMPLSVDALATACVADQVDVQDISHGDVVLAVKNSRLCPCQNVKAFVVGGLETLIAPNAWREQRCAFIVSKHTHRLTARPYHGQICCC